MSSDKNGKGQGEGDAQTLTADRVRVKKPTPFKVLLLNDDYTTMDFVVSILETIFKKSPTEAVRIMLQVHHKGVGVCGIYPKQIAESKVALVQDRAVSAGYPLRCTLEEA